MKAPNGSQKAHGISEDPKFPNKKSLENVRLMNEDFWIPMKTKTNIDTNGDPEKPHGYPKRLMRFQRTPMDSWILKLNHG